MSAWLSGLPTLVQAAVVGLLFAVVVVLSLRLGHRLPHADTHAVAAPLMPALGATFAVLAALTMSSQLAEFRAADDGVVAEAAGAARLGWASVNQGVDAAAIQERLGAYLDATTGDGWAALGRGQAGSPVAKERLAELQRTVHEQAALSGLGSGQASELLASVDDLSRLRRARIAVAGRHLEDAYLFVLVLSGLALTVNATLLTFGRPRVVALLPLGLVCVVVFAIVLAVDLGAPFRGGLIVSKAPLVSVADDLRSGYFQP